MGALGAARAQWTARRSTGGAAATIRPIRRGSCPARPALQSAFSMQTWTHGPHLLLTHTLYPTRAWRGLVPQDVGGHVHRRRLHARLGWYEVEAVRGVAGPPHRPRRQRSDAGAPRRRASCHTGPRPGRCPAGGRHVAGELAPAHPVRVGGSFAPRALRIALSGGVHASFPVPERCRARAWGVNFMAR